MPYHQFLDENGEPYGSFLVEHNDSLTIIAEPEQLLEPGWYWIACFPGCIPDSEFFNGPFETEEEAVNNAQQP